MSSVGTFDPRTSSISLTNGKRFRLLTHNTRNVNNYIFLNDDMVSQNVQIGKLFEEGEKGVQNGQGQISVMQDKLKVNKLAFGIIKLKNDMEAMRAEKMDRYALKEKLFEMFTKNP